jgi:hypothetical protein
MEIRVLIQVVLITLAIHSAGCTDSSDKTLWGLAEYGMTPAQILKVFPDAQPADTDTEESPDILISISSIRISNTEFAVKFIFKNERLKMVRLKSKETSNSEITHLAGLLTENYGEPVVNENENDKVKIIKWDDAPLKVTSYIFHYSTKSPRLLIFYSHSEHDTLYSL